MKGDGIEVEGNSAGLPGVLRLTAGFAVLALAVLADWSSLMMSLVSSSPPLVPGFACSS
jgi:hypothetical protein